MRDRRQEFMDVKWQQGRLLYTRSVQMWSPIEQQKADADEKRRAFAYFTSQDEGRSREFLFEFDSAEECTEAVKQHNAALEAEVRKP